MDNKKSNKFTRLMPMFPNRALRRKKKKLGEYVPPKEGEWRSNKCQNNCGDDCFDWCPHYEDKLRRYKNG